MTLHCWSGNFYNFYAVFNFDRSQESWLVEIGGNRRSKFQAFQPTGVLSYFVAIWHNLGFRLCPSQLWIRSTGPLSSSRVSKDFAASLVSNAKWFVWQVWKSWHCTTENDFYATAVGVLLFRAASEQQTTAAAAAAAAEQVQGREEDFKRTPRGSMIHGGTPKKVQIRRKMRLLSPLHADQPAHDNGVSWFLQEDSYF